MYQFFVEENQIGPEEITILGTDVNHIRNVLRMKQGEKIRISCRENGRSWFCHILEILPEEVRAAIDMEDLVQTELPCRVTLYQGLPKSDKMELIIQKSVELGVCRIVPVAMKNCVMKLDEKKADAKIKRWQAIAESAAKQSKRTIIPEIGYPLKWKAALQEAAERDLVLIPYENERGMEATRELISSIRQGEEIAIMIGPEGGFADEEIAEAKEAGQTQTSETQTDVAGIPADQPQDERQPSDPMREERGARRGKIYTISLGRRILRTETAGPAALAMLTYQLDS